MDALMRLAEGEAPVDVFQDVGFDDLSRFYKIFRKVACATPGKYRPPRSRNAKTGPRRTKHAEEEACDLALD
jgi:methylphosphotriester-DNA--protein-cysteine methyltransferase